MRNTECNGRRRTACRTGLQCAPLVHEQIGTDKIHGTVRLSIGAFNTVEHIDKAIEAVDQIASIKRKHKIVGKGDER